MAQKLVTDYFPAATIRTSLQNVPGSTDCTRYTSWQATLGTSARLTRREEAILQPGHLAECYGSNLHPESKSANAGLR
jgi:hypothetical protein